jgi:hypothetical protein
MNEARSRRGDDEPHPATQQALRDNYVIQLSGSRP